MPCKVLLDTNVVIAASLKFYVNASKLDVKHDFYDQSSKLFELIRKNLDKRVGIITSTVEEESFGVLLKALNSTIDKNVTDPEKLKQDYDAMTTVANLCESNMRKLLALLLREPISETSIQQNLRLVEDMCSYLY